MEKSIARSIKPAASTTAVKMTNPRYHGLCATETTPVINSSDDDCRSGRWAESRGCCCCFACVSGDIRGTGIVIVEVVVVVMVL